MSNSNGEDKKNAAVFIDYSNYHYFIAKQDWRIDWRKFINYFSQKYKEVIFFYYEGIPSKSQYFDIRPKASYTDFNQAKRSKKRYFQFLRNLDMTVRSKPVGRVYDNTEGKFKHKCNFDVELTIDALDKIDFYNDFILCSGDGDFERLVKYLKAHYKKTIVIAPSRRFSTNLWKAASRAIALEDLRNDFARER